MRDEMMCDDVAFETAEATRTVFEVIKEASALVLLFGSVWLFTLLGHGFGL